MEKQVFIFQSRSRQEVSNQKSILFLYQKKVCVWTIPTLVHRNIIIIVVFIIDGQTQGMEFEFDVNSTRENTASRWEYRISLQGIQVMVHQGKSLGIVSRYKWNSFGTYGGGWATWHVSSWYDLKSMVCSLRLDKKYGSRSKHRKR